MRAISRMARLGRRVRHRRATVSVSVSVSDHAGLVTGCGRFVSPVGACTRAPSVTGVAAVSFSVRSKKGSTTPEGLVELRFPAGFTSFRSTSHQWLVLSGRDAMCEGTGTLNGARGYSFLLTARQGDERTVDAFRMRIWSTATGVVTYDSDGPWSVHGSLSAGDLSV